MLQNGRTNHYGLPLAAFITTYGRCRNLIEHLQSQDAELENDFHPLLASVENR